MRVKLYEVAQNTDDVKLIAESASLAECFPGDYAAQKDAEQKLERDGEMFVGGGAAQLFKLVKINAPTPIQLNPKSTAVLIRGILKKAFPGVKFSVVTERGSMVSSVSVRWIDGPTAKAVEALVEPFEEGRFDGMTDSYDYNTGADRYIIVDGQTYKRGVKYTHCYREISAELANECIAKVAAWWGGVPEPLPVAIQSDYGIGYKLADARGHDPIRSDLDRCRNTWFTEIRRCAEQPGAYVREETSK